MVACPVCDGQSWKKPSQLEKNHRFCSMACLFKGRDDSNVARGAKHYRWKGGVGSERKRLMQQKDYVLWRTAVFVRDDYTCQSCTQRGGVLQADHIKPWALYPDLRYAIDNGRTLCVPCHKQIGWRGSHVDQNL